MNHLDLLWWELAGVPWLVPALVLGLALAVPLAWPLARRLGVGRPLGWLLLAGVALVVAATLTPGSPPTTPQPPPLSCDTSRVVPAPLDAYLAIDEESLNVLLFVPLGFAAGLVSRPPGWLVATVVALPLAVEAVQSAVVVLGRACQTGDVVDNLLGLALGATCGVAFRRLAGALR